MLYLPLLFGHLFTQVSPQLVELVARIRHPGTCTYVVAQVRLILNTLSFTALGNFAFLYHAKFFSRRITHSPSTCSSVRPVIKLCAQCAKPCAILARLARCSTQAPAALILVPHRPQLRCQAENFTSPRHWVSRWPPTAHATSQLAGLSEGWSLARPLALRGSLFPSILAACP